MCPKWSTPTIPSCGMEVELHTWSEMKFHTRSEVELHTWSEMKFHTRSEVELHTWSEMKFHTRSEVELYTWSWSGGPHVELVEL